MPLPTQISNTGRTLLRSIMKAPARLGTARSLRATGDMSMRLSPADVASAAMANAPRGLDAVRSALESRVGLVDGLAFDAKRRAAPSWRFDASGNKLPPAARSKPTRGQMREFGQMRAKDRARTDVADSLTRTVFDTAASNKVIAKALEDAFARAPRAAVNQQAVAGATGRQQLIAAAKQPGSQSTLASLLPEEQHRHFRDWLRGSTDSRFNPEVDELKAIFGHVTPSGLSANMRDARNLGATLATGGGGLGVGAAYNALSPDQAADKQRRDDVDQLLLELHKLNIQRQIDSGQ